MRLDGVRGFVFDVDGTLAHRSGHDVRAAPGAREVLERIRASGRPFVLFTNGSHIAPSDFAREMRDAGLPVADDQVLTPLCSVRAHLQRLSGDPRVLLFSTEAARRYLEGSGVRLVGDGDLSGEIDAVFVAHPNEVDFDQLERAARAIRAGARLLTGSYVPAYAGADGPVFSRGAMTTAALAKAGGVRPTVVGKPSRAAVREIRRRLGVPTEEVAVVGDDVFLDVALGHLGGSWTVLVRTGISATVDLDRLAEHRRPHAVVPGIGQLLDWL